MYVSMYVTYVICMYVYIAMYVHCYHDKVPSNIHRRTTKKDWYKSFRSRRKCYHRVNNYYTFNYIYFTN